MELCHIKNSQLGKEFWTYKGRLVFRGDIVKDENGQFAVFTEQGASASHMAAAKFVDAISRLSGNSGEDSDAVGAYTQVAFKSHAFFPSSLAHSLRKASRASDILRAFGIGTGVCTRPNQNSLGPLSAARS